jgi:hypothetical protein
MSLLAFRILAHPTRCFSTARVSRSGWLQASAGYCIVALSEALAIARVSDTQDAKSGLSYWSLAALPILSAVILGTGTFVGSRLLRGRASLAVTLLLVGWAAFWPALGMLLIRLLRLQAGTSGARVLADGLLALLVLACWVWYVILATKASRAANQFGTARASATALAPLAALLVPVLWHFFVTVRGPSGVVR